MQFPSELEQPLLSTDLEWMLSSSQTSAELIVEAIVREHYASLLCLADAYLGDRQLAVRALQMALVSVVEDRHRFRQSKGFNQWLFQKLITACRHLRTQVPQTTSRDSIPGGDPAFDNQVPISSHSKEEELWQMVKESGEPAFFVLLLYYLIGFSSREIAEILTIQEADTTSILAHFHDWMHLIRPEGIALGEDAESWVIRTLQSRWPRQSLSEADQTNMRASVIRSLNERSRRKQIFNLTQQILSVVVVLALLAVIGWFTNRYFRIRPQKVLVYVTATFRPYVTQQAPPDIPTEIPDRVAQRLLLARQDKPLDISSSADEIRQRMYESRTLWSNVWVDAQIIRYGPDGFDGPAQVYRNLMWISNPGPGEPSERRLVISGSTERGSLYASLVLDRKIYEIDLRNGLAYTYNLRQNDPFYDAMHPGYRGMYSYDLRGILDGSYLSSMLFGAGLVSLPGELIVIGQGRMLGRDVLIVVNQLDDGHLEQFWLETHTGMVLRWQGYSDRDPRDALRGYSGRDPRHVLAEMDVTSVAYDTEFPSDVLSSASFLRPPVAWDDPGGVPVKSSPRCLTFKWPDEIQAQDSLSNNVQVFADGYFIGQVQMSEPWHIQCKRSANGGFVACLNPPPGVGTALYAKSSLFWFNLSNLKESHLVLPEATWISSDFAFSPDGNFLAFWACPGRQESCGIYVLDTVTQQSKKLIDEPPAATFFAWSPDSKYLSFVETGQTIQEARNFVVVKVDTGEIAETGSFFWPDMSIPRNSLAHDLGIPFIPLRDEFNACAQPHTSTQ